MRKFDQGLSTGASRARNAVELIDLEARFLLYGTAGSGTMSGILDTGGPLDAPDWMPAGACNCTEWTDSAGRGFPAQNEIRREG